jgi:hypothetical protein
MLDYFSDAHSGGSMGFGGRSLQHDNAREPPPDEERIRQTTSEAMWIEFHRQRVRHALDIHECWTRNHSGRYDT